MSDPEYILPQDRSIDAADCQRLLEAIKAGKLDEFDLKNEINAQWTKGYEQGANRESCLSEIREAGARLEALLEARNIIQKANEA
jgi:hypothetical protein